MNLRRYEQQVQRIDLNHLNGVRVREYPAKWHNFLGPVTFWHELAFIK